MSSRPLPSAYVDRVFDRFGVDSDRWNPLLPARGRQKAAPALGPRRSERLEQATPNKPRARPAQLAGQALTDRNAVIRERRDAGDTLQAIADDLGITRERVRQILAKPSERDGTPKKVGKRRRSAALVQRYRAGEPLTSIGEALGMDYREILVKLRRLGEPPRDIRKFSDQQVRA